MVRAIVGTMIMIGEGKVEPKEMGAIIEKKDRSSAGFSVPANGLFLLNVSIFIFLFFNTRFSPD